MRTIWTAGIFLLVASWTVPVQAEATAQEFLQRIDGGDKLLLYVLDGYANGFMWANVDMEHRTGQKLFCPPEKLAITAEQTADILRQHLKDSPKDNALPAGLALLLAEKATFPC